MTALVVDMRELNIDEIDAVAGGPGPLVALVPFIPHVVAGVTAVAVATIAAVTALRSDDCTTVTVKKGNMTKETKTCT